MFFLFIISIIHHRGVSGVLEMLSGDLVAVWEVALSDGVYRIEFAHGTTTGKRVVYINGQVRGCAVCVCFHRDTQNLTLYLV